MLELAQDFKVECQALFDLLKDLDEEAFEVQTQFKQWTINDVIAHLHIWNYVADLSLNDAEAFGKFYQTMMGSIKHWDEHLNYTHQWLKGLTGQSLLKEWQLFSIEMANRFAEADPKMRVTWAGPSMSARSSLTARLMETWAHGQAVYDILGQDRSHIDSVLKNIVVMGVNTFGWTFANRKLPVPEQVPYLKLSAPSGKIWEWNEPSSHHSIEGQAVEFCQVVTQVRNIGDTQLNLQGEPAKVWMETAQCFAGPPETPPQIGTRFKRRK